MPLTAIETPTANRSRQIVLRNAANNHRIRPLGRQLRNNTSLTIPPTSIVVKKDQIEIAQLKNRNRVSFDKVFFAVSFLVAGIFAVGFCTRLYQHYLFDTNVRSAMIIYNKKVGLLPNATICLPFDAKELDDQSQYYSQYPSAAPYPASGNGYGYPTNLFPKYSSQAPIVVNSGFGNGYGFGYSSASSPSKSAANVNPTIPTFNANYSGYGIGNRNNYYGYGTAPTFNSENVNQSDPAYGYGTPYFVPKNFSLAPLTANYLGYGYIVTNNTSQYGFTSYPVYGESTLPTWKSATQTLPVLTPSNWGFGYGYPGQLVGSKTPYTDALKEYLGAPGENSARYFLNYNKDSPWPPRVLYIAHKYLTIFQEIEELREGNQNPFQNLRNGNETDDEWNALVEVLVPKMISWNVTLDQFRNKFSEQLLLVYQLQIVQTINFNAGTSATLEDGHFSYVDGNQACMEFALDAENNDATFMDILVNRGILPNLNEKFNRPITIYIAGQRQNNDQPIISASFGGDVLVVSLTGLTVTTVLPRKTPFNYQCSENKTLANCQADCRNNVIEKMCGCSSSTLTLSTSAAQLKKPECTFEQYEQCLASFVGDEDEQCRKDCPDICQEWQYFYDEQLVTPSESDVLSTQVKVEIVFDKLKYIVFEESYLWSFGQFFGAAGGIIWLFLGLNLVSVIQISYTKAITFISSAKISSSNGNRTEIWNLDAFFRNSWRFISQNDNININYSVSNNTFKFSVITAIKLTSYFVGGLFAIKISIVLLENYLNDTPSLSFTLMFNKTITLPAATICLTFRPEQLQPWTTSGPYMYSTQLPNSYLKLIGKYLNETDGESFIDITSQAKAWPPTLTYISHIYLYGTEAAEREKDPIPVDLTYGFSTKYPPSFNDIDFVAIEAVTSYLIPKIRDWNITTENLRQKFLNELCNLHAFEIFFENETSRYDLFHSIELKSIERKKVCFQVPSNEAVFLQNSDHIDITVSKASLPNPTYYYSDGTEDISYFGHTDERKILTLNFDYDNFGSADAKLLFYYGANRQFSLAIDAKYQKLPLLNGELRCSENQNMGNCLANCRIKLIDQLCNCSAISYAPSLTENLSKNECSYELYENCLYYIGNDDQNCKENCQYSCDSWNFVSEVLTEVSESSYVAHLKIRVGSFNYPVLEETSTWTWETFVAVNGGVWSALVGFDCISLIALIFTLCGMLYGICKREEKMDHNTDKNKLLEMKNCSDGMNSNRIAIMPTVEAENVKSTKPNPKQLLQTLFWIILFITSVALCLKLSVNLYKQIKKIPPSLNLKIIFNQSIGVPATTICVPLSPSELDQFAKHGEVLRSDFYTHFVQQYFNDANEETVIGGNEEWPTQLLFVMREYFLVMDRYFGDLEVSSELYSNQEIPSFTSPYPATDLIEALDLMAEIFNQLNISSNKLKQKFSKELRKVYQIEALHCQTCGNETTIESLLEPKMSSVFQSAVCYLFDRIQLSSTNDRFRIKIDRSNFSTLNSSFNIKPILLAFTGYFDYNSEVNLLNSPILLNFGTNFTASLSIGSVYQATPFLHGFERCSGDKNKQICFAECRNQLVEENCNCSVGSDHLNTSSKMYPSKMFDCKWDQMKDCTLESENVTNFCANSCLGACERMRYSATRNYGSSMMPDRAQIDFIIQSFQYSLFTETDLWSIERFFGAIGGLAGIFLGLNILIVARFTYTLISTLVNVNSKKKKRSRKVQSRRITVKQQVFVDFLD